MEIVQGENIMSGYLTLSSPFFVRFKNEGYISINRKFVQVKGIVADIVHALKLSPLTFEDITQVIINTNEIDKGDAKTLCKKAINILKQSGIIKRCENADSHTEYNIKNIAIQINKIKDFLLHYNATYPPLSVSFYINNKCNQNCVFCFLGNNYKTLNKNNNELTYDDWINVLKKLINWGVPSYSVGGKEPFLSFELLIKIISFLHTRGAHISVVTNGTAMGGISPKHVKALSNFDGLEIGVSLHSHLPWKHNKLTGFDGYDIAIKSIKNLLRNKKIRVGIQSVVTKHNIKDIIPLINKCSALGVKDFYIQYIQGGKWCEDTNFFDLAPLPRDYYTLVNRLNDLSYKNKISISSQTHPIKLAEANLKYKGDLLKFKSLNFCSAGYTGLIISSNGDIYPCPNVIGMKNFRIGNVMNDNLGDLWINSPILNKFRILDRSLVKNTSCRGCSMFEYCRSGCIITSMYALGDLYKGDPRCPNAHEEGNIWR